MWFRNLIPYRFDGDIATAITQQIEQQLSAYPFVSCGRQERQSIGWVPPLGAQTTLLCHTVGHHWLLCARKEEKLLPASVINQTLQDELNRLKNQQSAPLRKGERQAMKEQIMFDLLPRAFSQFHETRLWVDSQNGILAVDATSAQKAEEILALLRKSLGSLPVTPLLSKLPTTTILTQWVKSGHLPAGFTLQEEAELRSNLEDGAIIRCKHQSLMSDEIAAHLAADKVVTQLALEWQQQIQFVITEAGLLKRLKFASVLQQQNDDIDSEAIAQRLDADFALATAELSALLAGLIGAFAL